MSSAFRIDHMKLKTRIMEEKKEEKEKKINFSNFTWKNMLFFNNLIDNTEKVIESINIV